MQDGQQTHFRTDLGALCGALPPYNWSFEEAEITCWKCRALLQEEVRRRRPNAVQSVVTVGRLRQRR